MVQKDWNDDSAKSKRTIGKKINDSAPYSEDVIDDITDMVIARLIGKKNLSERKGAKT